MALSADGEGLRSLLDTRCPSADAERLSQNLIHPRLPARPAGAQGGKHVGIEADRDLFLQRCRLRAAPTRQRALRLADDFPSIANSARSS
jgi:hypothetical protein